MQVLQYNPQRFCPKHLQKNAILKNINKHNKSLTISHIGIFLISERKSLILSTSLYYTPLVKRCFIFVGFYNVDSTKNSGKKRDFEAYSVKIGLLKTKLLYLQDFLSFEQFISELEAYIERYNTKCIKPRLDGLSPVVFMPKAA